ncbi:MAG: C4-type zinc ribbon domain-containing protein, partial [Pseudomonadota bacterium]
ALFLFPDIHYQYLPRRRVVHPQVSILVELQSLDLRIGKIEGTKESYPRRIELLRQRAEEARKITESKREKLENLEKDRRRQERFLEEEIEKVRKSEERLLLVKTNKEYQAALKEIAVAKQCNSEREEEILNILEGLDVLRKESEEKEADFRAISREFEKEQSELTEKLEEFEKQLVEKLENREKLSSEIDPEILKTYENIKKRRQGIAVVRTKNGSCLGCYVDIPPQVFYEVQRGTDLVSCPNCNRILYWTLDS